ncbi:MAG: amidohydrolase [archaeon GB-1867-035]|nr:amidohydrolase [Candidatus Culexmicrobium profundum]
MSSILIKNCRWIVTQDEERSILKNCSVYIEDGLIAEVSSKIPVEAENVIDGSRMICLPGLINLHTHSPMSLLRGYADDLPLMEWLENKIWPVERKLSPYHCYLGALVSFMEMVKTGTTFFVDMYWNPIEIARAADEIGLKGVVSIGVLDDFKSYLRDFMIREVEKFIVDVKRFSPRVIGAIGPHAPYTCSEELLLKCVDIAEREDCLLHIHLAETRREQALFEEKFGVREVTFLSNLGFLSPKVLAAHCVWLSKNEVKLLGESGVRVAHCPVSNMKLAVGGVAPLPELIECGVTVGLGTDGPASNNSLDMFETMKFCSLIHKHHRWDPTMASAQLVLDLATINGAKAVMLENVCGRIAEGFAADLVLLNSFEVNLLPNIFPHSIVSHLVYSARGFNVSHVIVDGELIYSNGRFTRVDEGEIYSRFLSEVEKLLSP